jgi:hypothetical protein
MCGVRAGKAEGYGEDNPEEVEVSAARAGCGNREVLDQAKELSAAWRPPNPVDVLDAAKRKSCVTLKLSVLP